MKVCTFEDSTASNFETSFVRKFESWKVRKFAGLEFERLASDSICGLWLRSRVWEFEGFNLRKVSSSGARHAVTCMGVVRNLNFIS